MNVRICIFTILLAALIFQGNIFASAEDFNESQGLAQFAENDKWGEPNHGLATQLIPQSEEYVIGKPMKFGLVLKNVSDSVKQYDRQEAICVRSLIVKTADNNEIYYKKGFYQTSRGFQKIEPNEIVALFENRDITDEYVILKPGKYTIQFSSVGTAPASNVIEFEVKPGTPDKHDYLISLLVYVLPDANWYAEIRNIRSAPAGRKEEVISIDLVHRHPARRSVFVTLWQTKLPAEVDENKQDTKISEYLGKNPSGYFYLEIPPEAIDYWPKIKEDIAKALKLDSQR